MASTECARTSTVSINLNKRLYRTGQLNYMSNKIYHAIKWFNFANYITIDSL